MNVLGIETSCDDTSAAVVASTAKVLSSIVSSQDERHGPHGGVVPEIASRAHVEGLPIIISRAMESARMGWSDIDAVAVTRGPGLASSLLPGIVAARALAYRLNKPLWALNHLEAHIYSVFLDRADALHDEVTPALVLTVSGGHTNLIVMHALHHYELIGVTIDDAAGEALDKAAKLLGLGYPGGPAIEKAATKGDPAAIDFPRGGLSSKSARFEGALDPQFCFSFSGLKTALLYYLKRHPETFRSQQTLADVAASYQAAVIAALSRRVELALSSGRAPFRSLACAGGVMRNRRLRNSLERLADAAGIPLLLAQPQYCTDNAAMVAGLGAALHDAGVAVEAQATVAPRLPLGADPK